MSTRILLAATATRWYGTARMPRAFARAGFEVVLLTPRRSLAESSRFVTRVEYIEDAATPRQWLNGFTRAVEAWMPRIVVPCDDTAFRLLATLVLTPPDDMPAERRLMVTELVRNSLGEPAHYRASVDKTLLPHAAERIGVRMPPCAAVTRLDGAEAFASAHGFPVVLKRAHSSGGDGVEICTGHADLARAFAAFSHPTVLDLGDASDGRVLIQAHVSGRVKVYTFLAWNGNLLTGYAGERMAVGPEEKGPITVNRYHCDTQLRDAVVKLARGLGMTGMSSPEFIVEDGSGDAYLLEINRRLVGGAHRGSDFDVDHAAALQAVLHGQPMPTRASLDPGEEHLSVHFPQEWLRDPESHWLRDYPVDVPWDDPDLLQALVETWMVPVQPEPAAVHSRSQSISWKRIR